MSIAVEQLARKIDHSLLTPEATPEQIDLLCDEAVTYGFGAVCVNPVYVRRVARRLTELTTNRSDAEGPAIVSVAGFPLGTSTTDTKADEARRAIDDGASEIDMVVHLGALIESRHAAVRKDIATLAHVVHRRVDGGVLKVILECRALTTQQIILGCRCCAEGEADFVKTSTGMHPSGGATTDIVQLLYRHASPLLIKAAGGIRTAKAALEMIAAGAARIGSSSSVAMIEELRGGLALTPEKETR